MNEHATSTNFQKLQAAQEELAEIAEHLERGRALEVLITELERVTGITSLRIDTEYERLVGKPRDEQHQRQFTQELLKVACADSE